MLKLKPFEDEKGSLIPIEFKDVPFEVKRLFLIKNVPRYSIRGEHAHFKTKQLLICLKGHIEIFTHDGKTLSNNIIKENETFFIDRLIWDYQQFLTNDCEMLVLCSTNYILEDYITNFEQFLKIKNI